MRFLCIVGFLGVYLLATGIVRAQDVSCNTMSASEMTHAEHCKDVCGGSEPCYNVLCPQGRVCLRTCVPNACLCTCLDLQNLSQSLANLNI